MNFKFVFLIICSLFLFLQCNNKKEQSKAVDEKKLKQTLEQVNKKLIKTEDEEIDALIKRYRWKMKKTPTGLRYLVYKEGNGLKAETGKTAVVNYEIKLINGTLCYSSKQTGPKSFVIDRALIETGLNEGVLLLRVGDKAKFILPSYLAFGLHGDDNKIPKRATLIYDVELIELKDSK